MDSYLHVGSGADLDVITQNAIGGQRFVADCRSTQHHQLAVAGRAGGVGEGGTALERGRSGQLADNAAALRARA